jgi:uncharacterized protein (TIGR00106 family)
MYGGKERGLPEKGWAVAEVFITPLGTNQPTIRDSVRAVYEVARASGLTVQLTAMGTLIEGPVSEIFDVARRMHDACFDAGGTQRVLTTLRLDERRGEPLSLAGKVQGVLGSP